MQRLTGYRKIINRKERKGFAGRGKELCLSVGPKHPLKDRVDIS